MTYTLVRSHCGERNVKYNSMKAALADARRALQVSRVFRATSYADDQGRDCYEVYPDPQRNHPDGDPYAYFIRVEKKECH